MVLGIKRVVPDPLDEQSAEALQLELARALHPGTQFKQVAGVSLVYAPGETRAHVAAVVMSTTTWSVVHSQEAVLEVTRARVADFENFREGPLFLAVLQRLVIEPDVVFVEGHGIAHPRKFGVAAHVGLALDVPTLGVGDYWPTGCAGSPNNFPTVRNRVPRGSRTALRLALNGNIVGHEIYTRPEQRPLYVSPGHRVGVDEASELVLRASPWHRFPEPLQGAREMARASLGRSR
jgi:deoxyribonuclease V